MADSSSPPRKLVPTRDHGDRVSSGIKIHPVGHQTLKQRAGPPQPPDLNTWRSNLLALSHTTNLLFIACGSQLWVYRPVFPAQTLSPRPALIIEAPVSKDAKHLVDWEGPRGVQFQGADPHSINHVVVQALGNEEVVVCARDDGDVAAWYVNSINNAIESLEDAAVELTCSVPPFFHVFVGAGAWGIAVHSKARKIAISSNTHQIVVFAFALLSSTTNPQASQDTADSSSASDDDDSDELDDTRCRPPGWRRVFDKTATDQDHPLLQDRSRDVLLTLTAHFGNIPSIAFCNTPDDPDGRWLVSGDVAGTTCLHDLFTATTVRYLKQAAWPNALPSGSTPWSLLWLDRNAFEPTNSLHDALGACRTYSHVEDPNIYRYEGKGQPTPRKLFSISISDNKKELYAAGLDRELIADHALVGERTPQSHAQVATGDIIFAGHAHPDETYSHSWISTPLDSSIPLENTFTEMSRSQIPNVPLLRCSENAVHLFQSPDFCRRDVDRPVLSLWDAFGVEEDESVDPLAVFNRNNLCHAIPELGVVLFATPKGAVGVLKLHQISDNPFQREPGSRTTDSGRGSASGPVFTMRLVQTLPMNAQKERGEVPSSPLIGLATGPVQGQLDQPGTRASNDSRTRSWRIMLLFADHTTMAYQIQRKDESVVVV